MKDNSFRSPVDHLDPSAQEFVNAFEDEEKREVVVRLMNQGLSLTCLNKLNVSADTPLSALVYVNRLCAMMWGDGKLSEMRRLPDYGIDCNLPLRNLEAMSHAIVSYRWTADMVKKLAPLSEEQIDVVMVGYVVCKMTRDNEWFMKEVLNPDLSTDEMFDKINQAKA